jgi:membrane-associated phospholipid phosphatase
MCNAKIKRLLSAAGSAVTWHVPVLIMFMMLFLPAAAYAGTRQPYELSPYREFMFFGAGTALLTTEYFIKDYHPLLTPDDVARMSRDDILFFDKNASYNWSPAYDRASDYTQYAGLAMPLTLMFSPAVRNDFLTIGVMYAETAMVAAGLTGVLKSAVARPRPYVYNENVSMEEKTNREALRSFPSGHTRTAFFSAVFLSSVFSEYYPDSKWRGPVWAASLALASATGFFRHKAGHHYPSDILAGAAIGAAAGYLVPYTHRRGSNLSLMPSVKNNNTMFSVGICF